MKAIFPGSFDPLTLGHLDVICRSLRFLDELIIAVMLNPDKKSFLPAEDRARLIETACQEKGLTRFRVLIDSGLLADLAKKEGCSLIIKGIRNATDLDNESSMARANALLLPGLETIFLSAGGETTGVSSSLVRQIAAFGGDISRFVPPCVEKLLKDRISTNNT